MSRNVFGDIAVIPHLPHADQAFALLTRLARIVEPIMISRGLFVSRLTEFLPQPEENLLGLNYGQGWWICIGLRKNNHRGINQFRPEEDLLDTLLHELTHNHFGPHDANFHAYLRGLKEQYYLLMSLQGDDRQPERQGDGRYHQDRDRDPGRRPQVPGGRDHDGMYYW
ncbi:WLM domain-containing protein [Tricharina praecox]|uniref:WLM domain-containing protein n=1 Tax=Tricharina praecox TaxID=43433 RepID=UPI0022211BB4|nr:WLM domain-containing protein [Tricharina praecox]KAI5852191.1 WLM domain-containing protein [Tricharina praecox]